MLRRQLKKQNEEIKEGESEVADFSKPAFVFKSNEQHEWRQQGPYIVCKSCELQHAVFVGMDRILTGLDEKGKPIFKKR
jgi:hypothetical protein